MTLLKEIALYYKPLKAGSAFVDGRTMEWPSLVYFRHV